MNTSPKLPAAFFGIGLTLSVVCASDCTRTSVGLVPINDLGSGLYLGQFTGGLYPGGNSIPGLHTQVGLNVAGAVRPLDTSGMPATNGKVVLLSIGMSNTTQEWCSQGGGSGPCNAWSFTGQAAADPRVNHSTLAIADGASGGQDAPTWTSPAAANYDRVRDIVLAPQGLSEAQVQVAWVKQADAGPHASLPSASADAYALETSLGQIVRAMKVRYPNLKLVFLSSRIYAGYATSTLNPEPYAYESGFAVKWLIESQIHQMGGGQSDPRAGDLNYNTVAPWLAWGPYMWADGLTPRSDGLTWACADFRTDDGTHPSESGQQRVGALLLNFFLSSPQAAPWFLSSAPCYANCDGSSEPPLLSVNDFVCFMSRFAAHDPYANCDGSTLQPFLNVNDFQCFVNRFAAGCPG